MWPIVAPDEIASRWRPLTAEEAASVEQRIADAQAELRSLLRDRGVYAPPPLTGEALADWQQLYRATIAEAVRRYLVNPDGWLEERDAVDDWDRTRRRDKAMSSGAIWIDPEDVDRLVPRPRARRGAFTIVLGQS